jgi:hypothetical protein
LKFLLLLLSFEYLLFSFEYYKNDEEILKEYRQYKLQKNFISLDDSLHKDYLIQDINLNNQLSYREKKLFNDTAYLQVFMIGTVGFLYLLPPSITKWEDTGDSQSLSEKWKEHVKAGPVWDEDDFAINYIGHPVSGAWYYMVAREDGYGPWGSFFYSFMLSTFFWEYGYEAFAEIPSTQDLILTPTIGALMGEGFFYLEKELDKNHGVIWGSHTLGNISYFLLNPIGRMTESMDKFFDVHVEFHYKTFQPDSISRVNPQLRKIDYVPSNYGFMLEIKF